MALVGVIVGIFYLINLWATSLGSSLGGPAYYSAILSPMSLVVLICSLVIITFSIKVYNHPDRPYPIVAVYVSYAIFVIVVTCVFLALTHGVI